MTYSRHQVPAQRIRKALKVEQQKQKYPGTAVGGLQNSLLPRPRSSSRLYNLSTSERQLQQVQHRRLTPLLAAFASSSAETSSRPNGNDSAEYVCTDANLYDELTRLDYDLPLFEKLNSDIGAASIHCSNEATLLVRAIES